MIQETKLQEQYDIDAAVDWAKCRGWCATFGAAVPGEAGKPTAGTAVLVRDGCDYGIAVAGAVAPHSRMTAVRVELGQDSVFTFAAAYFQQGTRLGPVNRGLLAEAALLQEAGGAPLILGADFNMGPGDILGVDFGQRSGTDIVAPRGLPALRKT